VPLALERQEGGNPAELDRFRVARAAYGVLADVVATASRGDVQSAVAYHSLAQWPRSIQLDVHPAGKRREIPSGKEQAIPGTLVMFTLIVLLTSGSIGLVIERRLGLLRRLAATPLSRAEIVFGKWLGVLALGLVQVAFGIAIGTFLFGLRWGPDFPFVALVLVAWAAFVTSLAMLLSGIAQTEGQCVGVGVLASNLLAALGGCWWPIEVTPRWMQSLASWLPTGWVMNALHRLVVFQTGPSGAYVALVWLVLGALALGSSRRSASATRESLLLAARFDRSRGRCGEARERRLDELRALSGIVGLALGSARRRRRCPRPRAACRSPWLRRRSPWDRRPARTPSSPPCRAWS
jgi:hypothetical protein